MGQSQSKHNRHFTDCQELRLVSKEEIMLTALAQFENMRQCLVTYQGRCGCNAEDIGWNGRLCCISMYLLGRVADSLLAFL